MNLADSRMDCLRGCLATLSVLVVIIALLEYSKIHISESLYVGMAQAHASCNTF